VSGIYSWCGVCNCGQEVVGSELDGDWKEKGASCEGDGCYAYIMMKGSIGY